MRILLYARCDSAEMDKSSLLLQLQKAGFSAEFAGRSLQDLGMRVDRVARFVKDNPADAWVICSSSREVNRWFSEQTFPSLAMYGRFGGLRIASAHPAHIPCLLAAIHRLIDLGHRRIVMFAREERRKPKLARPEQAFINELELAGIETGEYNLPDWEESCEGLTRRLDLLFRHSPPTALIFQETPIFIAARTHLAEKGIIAPRDVSMIAAEPDPSFLWSKPHISHFRWDHRPVVRRIVKWADNVARGKIDLRQCGTKAEFIEGGTIGPLTKRR